MTNHGHSSEEANEREEPMLTRPGGMVSQAHVAPLSSARADSQ
jgi:hypothetical protein